MKPLNILLVEDDAVIGALLAEMLAGLGHEIGPIQRTEEGAVAAAALRKPDLMIVDLRLAEGTGVAAVERITRASPIPHVFMSGNGPFTTIDGGVLLTKPFREVDLIRAISSALDQRTIGMTV
jgi:CheY-like chemotaxis protein